MNIAVIPARGGSKRIPRKNVKYFKGKPIIAYAIATAMECPQIDQVFVSTDDDEIAEIATSFGATVPWKRASSLSDDFATTRSVIQEETQKLIEELNDIQNVCCIYPTSPLLNSDYLSKGYLLLIEENWDYVFSAIKTEIKPQRFFALKLNRSIEMIMPEFELTRTQDLEDYYQDAGQFYWGKKDSWISGSPIFSKRSTVVEIPNNSAIDIDTETDWILAEKMYDNLRK